MSTWTKYNLSKFAFSKPSRSHETLWTVGFDHPLRLNVINRYAQEWRARRLAAKHPYAVVIPPLSRIFA